MELDDRLAKINKLKMSINNEIIKQKAEPLSLMERRSNRLLKKLKDRLLDVENILLIEKYDLVFIGKVGVGKTTVICHLFQLVTESKKKTTIKNKEKETKVIEELMPIGSGFTTLCEVNIKQDNSTFIEIDPYSPENVQKMIDDFCQSIWLKTYPDLDEETNDRGVLSPEITRAVKNFVKLSEKSAIKLASKFDKSAFNEFSTEVFNRANVSDRNEVQIFPKKEDSNLKSWLKVTFNNLNLGKIHSFSIPSKIIIHVQPSIISVGYDRIDSIVDTKGVDVEFNRQDLDTYICDRNNSICFFTEHFLAAPSNVIEIIERHMTEEAINISTKIVLLVMPRKNEPEKVVGQDGPVEDRETGLSLRFNQIQDIFNSRGIPFLKDNIIFYDPLEYYEAVGADHKILQDFEQNDIDAERKRIFTEIKQIIQRRNEVMWNEFQEINKLFLKNSLKRTNIKTSNNMAESKQQYIDVLNSGSKYISPQKQSFSTSSSKIGQNTSLFNGGKNRENKKIKCIDCHKDFIFTIDEQRFFGNKGYGAPIRCKYCRKLKRQKRRC